MKCFSENVLTVYDFDDSPITLVYQDFDFFFRTSQSDSLQKCQFFMTQVSPDGTKQKVHYETPKKLHYGSVTVGGVTSGGFYTSGGKVYSQEKTVKNSGKSQIKFNFEPLEGISKSKTCIGKSIMFYPNWYTRISLDAPKYVFNDNYGAYLVSVNKEKAGKRQMKSPREYIVENRYYLYDREAEETGGLAYTFAYSKTNDLSLVEKMKNDIEIQKLFDESKAEKIANQISNYIKDFSKEIRKHYWDEHLNDYSKIKKELRNLTEDKKDDIEAYQSLNAKIEKLSNSIAQAEKYEKPSFFEVFKKAKYNKKMEDLQTELSSAKSELQKYSASVARIEEIKYMIDGMDR